MAIFHGCGGVGANNARMAELLKSWGYVALVVDSFSSRGLKDVCGRHWPTQADAEKRAFDIDAAGLWLDRQDFVKPSQRAFMGYSYGGGVGLLRSLVGTHRCPGSRTAGEPPCWSIPIAGWARRSAVGCGVGCTVCRPVCCLAARRAPSGGAGADAVRTSGGRGGARALGTSQRMGAMTFLLGLGELAQARPAGEGVQPGPAVVGLRLRGGGVRPARERARRR